MDLPATNGKLTLLKFCPGTKFKGFISSHSIEHLSSSNNNQAAAISHIFGVDSIAPKEGVLSEEGDKLIPHSDAYWIVDPLDGTTNFAAGIPYWSISIARFVAGKPQSSFLIIPTLKKKFLSIQGEGVWLNNTKIEPNINNQRSECVSLCSRSIKILQKKPNSIFPGKIRLLGVSSLNLTSVAMGQTFGAIEERPFTIVLSLHKSQLVIKDPSDLLLALIFPKSFSWRSLTKSNNESNSFNCFFVNLFVCI